MGSYPRPAQLDIVYGRFPYSIAPDQPGPQPHYCLVLDVFADETTGEPWVIIALGTSQGTNELYAGEFLVHPHDAPFAKTRLAKATKFSLSRGGLAKLPYNETWFAVPPSRRGSGQTDPKIGVLDEKFYTRQLRAAGQAVDVSESLKALEAHPVGTLG